MKICSFGNIRQLGEKISLTYLNLIFRKFINTENKTKQINTQIKQFMLDMMLGTLDRIRLNETVNENIVPSEK